MSYKITSGLEIHEILESPAKFDLNVLLKFNYNEEQFC